MRFKEFEGEWEKCQIKDYGTIITGNTPSTADSENYQGEYLWASPADLDIGKFVIETQTKLSLKGFNKTRKLPFGTILVTCIGSTIGKMGMAQQEMSTNQQINSIISFPSNNKDYIYYAIKSRFPKYLALVSVQAVPILSKSSFEKLENYITTKDEQDKIGVFLSLIDERISTQIKIIEKFESLIKGLCRLLIMNNKPTTKIKDCLVCHSSTLSESEIVNDSGIFCVYGATGIIAYTSQYQIDQDSILIIKDGSGVGRVQYANGKYSTIGTLNSLTAKNNVCLKYLFYFLSIFNFEKFIVGSGIPHIYFKDYGEAVFYCPSYDEQQKTANVLTTITDKVEIEKQMLQKMKEQKQYLLSNLFI
ncbi:hypothetical protein HCG69_19085 [Bacteroides sp. K03]|uniref:restriction endonuclease subunit S n=2 Tax=unclassified Bacteroides TaxID=2646097 RepID=UPI001C8C51B9|nr:restriction endonuclease subunit S [Bacteroides sp. K03]MBX9190147.1 hypothetical protein [Bacteroides sp. K03]